MLHNANLIYAGKLLDATADLRREQALRLADRARRKVLKALQFKPDSAEAYHDLGIVLQELGRDSAAVVSFDRALLFSSGAFVIPLSLRSSEATQALAALRTTGWKTRYGVNPPEKTSHTTIKEAIESYVKLAKANLLANKTEDTPHWRDIPSHLRTLERWGEFMELNRHVSSISKDDFVFWIAASRLKPNAVNRIKNL